MKVVYVKPIWEKIQNAINEAESDCKQIEKIILTADEENALRQFIDPVYYAQMLRPPYVFRGVRIEVE